MNRISGDGRLFQAIITREMDPKILKMVFVRRLL